MDDIIYNHIATVDNTVSKLAQAEAARQYHGMELIASENYQSPAVRLAQATLFANKYAEGYPGKRYYGGQEYTDAIEQLAIDRAKKLFGADHANVQALSGAAANMAAYAAMMELGDTILGMDLSHGGHLTHGAPVTLLSKIYNFVTYKTHNGYIDYDEIHQLARTHKPRVIMAGFSAYPRSLDYDRFVQIANDVGAIAYADMCHLGGLIAGGVLPNPLASGFHAMMTTTHKSLRGPRGALILSRGIVSNPLKRPPQTIDNLPTLIDRAVFPGTQGGPHMHTIAAIAVALHEAAQPSFGDYARQILANAQAMAQEFVARGYTLVTGGTDNHMVIVDFSGSDEMDGARAESILEHVGISVSKSTVPDDPRPPYRPSGVRIGIQAMTTRGIEEIETRMIVDFIDRAWQTGGDEQALQSLRVEVQQRCEQYPLP